MATVQQGNLGAASPASPASQIPRASRAQAKKAFQLQVNKLAEAITLIPILDEATRGLKRGEALTFVVEGGQQVTYGRKEFKEFLTMIVRAVKRLPTDAFAASKTRRTTASGTGFAAPQRFRQEIIEFFSRANLGPMVSANYVLDEGKYVPDSRTIAVQTGTRLNDALYFTRPQIGNAQNPLYGITAHGVLTPLFALHVYFAGGQDPNNARFISATPEMRQILGGVMAEAINRDVAKFSGMYPQLAPQIQNMGQQAIQAINNPNLALNTVIGNGEEEDHMFNPNAFPFAHFSKIISAGKVPKEQQIQKAQLLGAAQQIIQAYQQLPEFANIAQDGEAAADRVIQTQRLAVAASRVSKTLVRGEEQKRRRQAVAQAKKAAAAQQALQAAAAANLGMLPGATFAPMGQLPGQLPGAGAQFGFAPQVGQALPGALPGTLPGGQAFPQVATPQFGQTQAFPQLGQAGGQAFPQLGQSQAFPQLGQALPGGQGQAFPQIGQGLPGGQGQPFPQIGQAQGGQPFPQIGQALPGGPAFPQVVQTTPSGAQTNIQPPTINLPGIPAVAGLGQ